MGEFIFVQGGGKIPVEEAQTRQLSYWRDRIGKELDEGTSKYADSDARRLAAIEAELAGRADGKPEPKSEPRQAAPQAAPQAAQPQRALARSGGTSIAVAGSYADGARVSAALQEAAATFNVVSPATVCGSLPAGCEVAISTIQIEPVKDGEFSNGETYNLSGKIGLGKVALDRIAGAAGVSWDPTMSGRLDDGSDPHYCHYRAVGIVRLFDGQLRTLTGEVEIDARDGSPQIDEIVTKAKNGKNGPRDPSSQILELRKFILRHAESKAKNRAIRSLGVQTSYKRDELAKPFAVARVMFTGRTEDPELSRIFAGKIADSFLQSSAQLYGGTASLPAHNGAQQAPALPRHAPPPIDTHGEEYAHEGEY